MHLVDDEQQGSFANSFTGHWTRRKGAADLTGLEAEEAAG